MQKHVQELCIICIQLSCITVEAWKIFQRKLLMILFLFDPFPTCLFQWLLRQGVNIPSLFCKECQMLSKKSGNWQHFVLYVIGTETPCFGIFGITPIADTEKDTTVYELSRVSKNALVICRLEEQSYNFHFLFLATLVMKLYPPFLLWFPEGSPCRALVSHVSLLYQWDLEKWRFNQPWLWMEELGDQLGYLFLSTIHKSHAVLIFHLLQISGCIALFIISLY